MVKHIRIKAASCLDMINAFNARIDELDSGAIRGSKVVSASDDGFLSDEEMNAIDRNGSDEELAIAAIAYNYGISWKEAEKEYAAIDPTKLQEFIDYYNDRDLPQSERVARAQNRKKAVSASDDQEPIMGAGEVDEAYVDDMMQYVADETVTELNATCSWSIEDGNLVFIIAGLEDESVEEYTCPLADLTGDADTDINYVLQAIGIGGDQEIV